MPGQSTSASSRPAAESGGPDDRAGPAHSEPNPSTAVPTRESDPEHDRSGHVQQTHRTRSRNHSRDGEVSHQEHILEAGNSNARTSRRSSCVDGFRLKRNRALVCSHPALHGLITGRVMRERWRGSWCNRIVAVRVRSESASRSPVCKLREKIGLNDPET
jgi:hypothetical protein